MWQFIKIATSLLFFVVGAFLVARHWETQLSSIGIERRYFASQINRHEADYLAAMRDTHLGSKTLLYRNPEIVFFGDSHTYSGWDFAALQEELPIKTGAQIIGGGLVSRNATGRAIPAAKTASTRIAGVAVQFRGANADGLGVADGSEKVIVAWDHEVQLDVKTAYRTTTHLDLVMFVSDDHTVTGTAAGTAAVRIPVGAMRSFVDGTSKAKAWVHVRRTLPVNIAV
jgi:hypothetical protein